MGLDRTIRFPAETPLWDAIRAHLTQVGLEPQLRMIDGLPAFPDEAPEPSWKELRVGFSAGMITLRRSANAFSCVVWGNADEALRSAWDLLCWACAATGNGTIDSPVGAVSADDFANSVGLSPE